MSVQPHKCQECDTIITTRRKTCSDACKQKAYRLKHGKKIDTIAKTVTVQQKKIAVQEKQIAVQEKQIADLNWLIHDLRDEALAAARRGASEEEIDKLWARYVNAQQQQIDSRGPVFFSRAAWEASKGKKGN